MPDTLDVMLVESHTHGADVAAAEREAGGHRVHRCFQPGDRGFPCTGVTDPAACPIDRGVDVALLVRSHVAPRPTAFERGVSCAIRAGVPVVEDGPAILDPFSPWLTARSDGDAAKASLDAVQKSFASLRNDIAGYTARLLSAAGIDPAVIQCRIELQFPRFHVHLSPSIEKTLRQALAVRVLDAVRASGRTYGEVDVSYDTEPEPRRVTTQHSLGLPTTWPDDR